MVAVGAAGDEQRWHEASGCEAATAQGLFARRKEAGGRRRRRRKRKEKKGKEKEIKERKIKENKRKFLKIVEK